MDKDKIEAIIKDQVHLLMGHHVKKIFVTDNLYNHLGMDEIDCIELMISLEIYFKIDMLEDQEQDDIHTVQDLIDYVAKQLEDKK